MTEQPYREDEQITPTSHRYRPSVVTNASGLAESTITFGSIMSVDGFARLSQFPPPPQELGFTPVEGSLDIPSPVVSDFSQATMETTSTTRRPLPVPPVAPVAPLHIQKRPTQTHPASFPPVYAAYPDLPPPAPSQTEPSIPSTSTLPPLSHTPSTISTYPSPHDWHDGSSSIANDPYGEGALSTSFITSLLSNMSDGGSTPGAPPSAFQLKRGNYEPSVISNALTTDSTITYPPPRLFPPPLPSPRTFPPLSSQSASAAPSDPPMPLTPPFIPQAGRSTPETLRSFDSGDTVRHPGSSISHMIGVAPGVLRSIGTTPSLQSLNSSTPLMQRVNQGEPILEEDEPRTGSGNSTPGKSRSTRGRRSSFAPSTKSAKSYVSSLVARISHSSGDRKSIKQSAASWFRGKPLPPVPPMPNIPFRDVRKAEDALALPALVNRAQILSAMLDNGQRPYDSEDILNQEPKPRQTVPTDVGYRIGPSADAWNSGTNPNLNQAARGRRSRSGDFSQRVDVMDLSPVRLRRLEWSNLSKRQRIGCLIIFMGVIVVITVAVTAGVVVGERKQRAHVCPGTFAGAACNLDASCTCTSTVAGQCKQLAESLFQLIPVVNAAFGSNYSSDDVATAIWEAQGSVSGNDCAAQVDLIDVAPALDSTMAPNRTQWAQAALLWDVVRSENLTANANLRDFIQHADWSSLHPADGPSSTLVSQFTFHNVGYDFNLAAQTITAPPATFVDTGQPSSAQISRVNDVAHAALDRMYSFALASSSQQHSALLHYWTGDLQQPASALTNFISRVEGSPILLPFDATLTPGSTPIISLIDGSSPEPFPPPLSCYPGLSSSQTQLINTLETSVFGLTAAPGANSFDSSCFPNRPIYGVLDVLQLRLPFSDSRTGVAKQAAVLAVDAYPRVVVYSGEAVSALPGSSAAGYVSSDPRDYGTMNHFEHVILKYLRSLDLQTATSLVNFVMNETALPPASTSPIFDAIPSFPLIEVALFGTIALSDITSVASSLTNTTDSGVFFGTTAAQAVRNWTIASVQQSVVWTENATAQMVVRDASNSNAGFNIIWDSSFNFFHTPNSAIMRLSNITDGFAVEGLYSS